MDADLEELWQAIRCRFRYERGVANRAKWWLYSLLYRLTRGIFKKGATW